jgi:PAS domain-containing protein
MRERFSDLVKPSGRESPLGSDEIIVSKTDLQGRITYANDVFLRVAKASETEVLGSPHCLVRNPEMPRGVFKLLWDTVQNKREIFAFVNNFSANGDNYWVFAHVTPSLDTRGQITGFHSSRRKPTKEQVAKIVPLYASMLDVERKFQNPKDAAAASVAFLQNLLKEKGLSYDEFIFSI